jgi:hypothetical protein
MLLAAALALALASPAPSAAPTPYNAVQTPPPEANHVTIEAMQSFLRTSGDGWVDAHGLGTQASTRYEFQAAPKLRLADSLHWERVSSTWQGSYEGTPFSTWFNFSEYDDELDVELGRPDYPTGVGVGYFDYNPIHDGPNNYNLVGVGLGVDRWPNYYVPRSFYYSAWYYPSVRGGTPETGTYGILRADAGMNFRFSLTRPWNLRVGFASDSWFARDPYATDTGFAGPYVALTFWR